MLDKLIGEPGRFGPTPTQRGSYHDSAGLAAFAEPKERIYESTARPRVVGKFIYVGQEKFFIRGVSYGAFRSDEAKGEYYDLDQIERDFALMSNNGVNTVRIPHTTPPVHLLDIALKHDLRVIVGLSAEQYVGYLIDVQKRPPDFYGNMRKKVRSIKGHPALLFYAIGNEIPAPVARYLGREKVENYLKKIYNLIKAEDPEAIISYVNYPSTEYLQLPFIDLLCFNVYLEDRERLEAYISRLHNIAGDRPLILSEVGLDALRNGELKQAEVLDWQIRSSFASGCAGVVIFSWTDEWYRAGEEVEDWAFGITDRQRNSKPALRAVQRAFSELPFPSDINWPRITVAVCSYNGSRTIRDTLEGIERLEYPDFEVVVVDDGSKDSTPAIASEYNCQLISTPNAGLSSARNIALSAATGEIIAYIDDDAIPNPHWLHHVAVGFSQPDVAMVGGDNLLPPNSSFVAECVNRAPGGPTHVLVTDEVAEHLPGCNMAIRKSCLETVGGFDPKFRVAGDDVDMCWRLQEKGWTLRFSPGAAVLHYRRNTMQGFWKQQKGYGKAEGMLAQKWPEKYNAAGHHTFSGRLYGSGLHHSAPSGAIVHYGVGGFAPFQSLYERAPGWIGSLPVMPEWYLFIGVLLGITCLGTLWKPLLLAGSLAIVAILISLIFAGKAALNSTSPSVPTSGINRARRQLFTWFLHIVQPLARLSGRVSAIGSPQYESRFCFPWKRSFATWADDWQEPQERLSQLKRRIKRRGGVVQSGGAWDRWDLEVFGGLLGSTRMLMAVEDHGAGTQFVRVRTWPRLRSGLTTLAGAMALFVSIALWNAEWIVGGVFGAALVVFLFVAVWQAGRATGLLMEALPDETG